jgi:choice-of-anchor C domain-containing protein
LPSWIVTGSSIDYINSLWFASNGSKSIDLNGFNAGGVTQTFDTIAGKSYQVNFDLAGNPGGGPTVKTLVVTAPNFSQNYSFDVTGHSFSSMGWTTKSFIFTASGSSSILGFTSTTSNSFQGPALDNVTVTQTNVPFEFSPEQGFIPGIPLFLGLRKLKKIKSK